MRILLAEDERALSRAIIKILERNNFSADAVYNGTDALQYLQSGEYDAAVLDIMMPEMDGLTVLQTLRREGNRVPVLLLTARAEIEDKVCGLDSGANDYLTKPFDVNELMARLRCITRTAASADNCLRFGDLVLDRTTFILTSPFGNVRLANKEFQLMEYFMANPNRVLSVDRMLERIWGYDTDAENRVVWVYISNLRRKLTALNANVQIKALRNAGYIMECTDDQEA